MKKIPISVFIIAFNEEERIARTIKSVKGWVDEIIVVVNSSSTDDTLKIAKKLGCKTYRKKWSGYGAQKIFGEKKCRNDWVLNIDADEVVTKELKNEIIKLFKNNRQGEFCGYRVRITNTLPFEKKPHKWAYSFNQTRLYNKQSCGFRDSPVHDSVIVEGVREYSREERKVIGQLNNMIAHYFMTSYTQLIHKWNRYSQMQAEDSVERGETASWVKILLSPTFAFFKAYLIRRYFVYGFDGLIFSYLYAVGKFFKYVKIRELTKQKKKR